MKATATSKYKFHIASPEKPAGRHSRFSYCHEPSATSSLEPETWSASSRNSKPAICSAVGSNGGGEWCPSKPKNHYQTDWLTSHGSNNFNWMSTLLASNRIAWGRWSCNINPWFVFFLFFSSAVVVRRLPHGNTQQPIKTVHMLHEATWCHFLSGRLWAKSRKSSEPWHVPCWLLYLKMCGNHPTSCRYLFFFQPINLT